MFTLPSNATDYAEALKSMIAALSGDAGLKANVTPVDMSYGLSSARALNKILATVIDETGVNKDGVITRADIEAISDAIQGNASTLSSFTAFHGTEVGVESGFHLLQNDGAVQVFQGQNAVNTVIDAIYHIGFAYSGDNLVDQNGSLSHTTVDVAGWLNYFLNGVNLVYGTGGDDYLTSGTYSEKFITAADEVFDAGAGNDQIYAGDGDDIVNAGFGDDRSTGGFGRDVINGGAGADQVWGEAGNDKINGEDDNDTLNGGLGVDIVSGGNGNDIVSGNEGSDRLTGGLGDDVMYGGEGNDIVTGNDGNDTMSGYIGDDVLNGMDGDDSIDGSDGNDRLDGGEGADILSGGNGEDDLTGGIGKDSLQAGEGADIYRGGAGADILTLWDGDDARDVLVFEAGDSGLTLTSIDTVNGFASGQDVINLRSFGSGMTFENLDFAGGHASVYFDGHYLRIDSDGDRASDLIIQFNSVVAMVEADFLFA